MILVQPSYKLMEDTMQSKAVTGNIKAIAVGVA